MDSAKPAKFQRGLHLNCFDFCENVLYFGWQKKPIQGIVLDINSLYNIARYGDKGAEEQLFQKLSERFFIFVQHRIWNEQDCEEIVQETLMTIKEKYEDEKLEKSFTAWAYGVLENKILHFLRSKRYHESKFLQTTDFNPARHLDSDPGFKRQLLDCLRKISIKNIRHARILNMHYQGYSIDEICGKFELTRNGVYILLSRARSLLKLCLEKGAIE